MKKNTLLVLAATFAAGTFYNPIAKGQNLTDAVRFSSNDLGGTARYRSMAGAFGALGGDLSCMGDNPAGLAIYRGTNTLSITPHLGFSSAKTQGTSKIKNKDNNFSVSSFGALFSMKNEDGPVVNVNLGFGIERKLENHRKYTLRNGNPQSSLSQYLTNQANSYLYEYGKLSTFLGTEIAKNSNTVPMLSYMAYDIYAIDDDPDDKYSVRNPMKGVPADQEMRVVENNRENIYNIAGSVNLNDQLYIGLNFKITDYRSVVRSEFDEYYKGFPDDALYYDNNIENKSTGFGINLGLLWKPTDLWRIGAAVHTPIWSTINEIYTVRLGTDFVDVNNEPAYADIIFPDDWDDAYPEWEYDFQTPWEYQFSTAYIFGAKGILSLEWDMKDYTTMKYSVSKNFDLSANTFNEINDAIKHKMQMQHTIKAGLEYRITKQFSARVGYAYVTSPYKNDVVKGLSSDNYEQNLYYSSQNKLNYNTLDNQYYITGGFGWRDSNWTIDLSCVSHTMNEYIGAYAGDYVMLNDRDIFKMSTNKLNWDLTLGYRF